MVQPGGLWDQTWVAVTFSTANVWSSFCCSTHKPGSSITAPGSGQGSQADPQGRTITSQAWDKKQGPGFACNAPWQWSLLLDFKDEMLSANGVFGDPAAMGRGENILSNAGWGAEVATEVKPTSHETGWCRSYWWIRKQSCSLNHSQRFVTTPEKCQNQSVNKRNPGSWALVLPWSVTQIK